MSWAASDARLPRVAILGRANVGKSTLFNRLVGRRRAITHPTPGVTRDPVAAPLVLAGRRAVLVDTGGFSRRPADKLEEAVSAASLAAAREAAVVLLVLEVDRLDDDDQELIERVRAWEAKTILVANKADSDKREAEAWNLAQLGFQRLIPVSAEHGRNIDALRTEIASLLQWHEGAEPGQAEETGIRLAILGRPNSGKSTLLNRLVGEPRALVSEVPGTTRDVIEAGFEFRGRRIVALDTAGVRRRTRIVSEVEYYSAHRALGSIRESEIVLLVVDASEGVAEQDKKIASVAVREGRGLIVALNKWDLLADSRERQGEVRAQARRLMAAMEFAPIVEISALAGHNLERLLSEVLVVHDQLTRRVSTGRLNQSLQEWLAEHPPSSRYNVKIRYGTQVSTNPQRFLFFVNKRQRLPASYERYLIGRLRRSFGLERVPIGVELRQKDR